MERLKKRPQARQYHVVLHESRWWVESDAGTCLHASIGQREAVTWAIRAAQLDHAQGCEVIVCVEQPDGSWTTVWHA